MSDQKIIAALVILLITILPFIVPYTYFYFLGQENVYGQLTPACIDFQQEQPNDISTNNNDNEGSKQKIQLHYDYQLCISCLSRYINPNDYTVENKVPSQFKITVKQQTKSYLPFLSSLKSVLNPQTIYNQNADNHKKRIIKINQYFGHINDVLKCNQIIQMLNYNKFNTKSTLVDINVNNIKFDTEITAIKDLIQILDMEIGETYENEEIYVDNSIDNFVIVQIFKRKINKDSKHEDSPKTNTYSSISQELPPLLSYQYPSKSVVSIFQSILSLFSTVSLIFIILIFFYKCYSSSTHKLHYDFVANLTIIIGFILSIKYYRFADNNIYMLCSQMLFISTCFIKLNMKTAYILTFVIINTVIIYPYLFISPQQIGESQQRYIVLVKYFLYIIAIIMVFFKSYHNIELLPLLIFITTIWILIIILSLKYHLFNDFKSLIAKDTLMILSAASIELVGRIEVKKFKEFGGLGGMRKFQEIKEFEEMEEQIEEEEEKQEGEG